KPQVSDGEEEDPKEAELFTNDRRDEVRVRLRQIKNLEAATETLPEPLPRAEAHSRLKWLVGKVLAVVGHVQPSHDTLPAICGEANRPQGYQCHRGKSSHQVRDARSG